MIERLNEIITIQKDSVVTDQYGNHKKGWTDYFTCHAYAGTFSQDEKGDAVLTDRRGITFEVRFCSELEAVTSTGYRVIFHDEIFNIDSVDMMNWQRKTIRLKCRKVERS